MPTAESAPLLRHVGGEIVWGRRGLIKINALWLPLSVYLTESPAGSAVLIAIELHQLYRYRYS